MLDIIKQERLERLVSKLVKVKVVKQALLTDENFKLSLGLDTGDVKHRVSGWIVDTSVEHDHGSFRAT